MPRRGRACAASSCRPPRGLPATGAVPERTTVRSRIGGPRADRRRTAALAARGERGHDDGEHGHILGGWLTLHHPQERPRLVAVLSRRVGPGGVRGGVTLRLIAT